MILEIILTTSQEVQCALLDLAGMSLPEVLLARHFSDTPSASPDVGIRSFGDAFPELMQPQQGVRRSNFIMTMPFCAAAVLTCPACSFIAPPQVAGYPITVWFVLDISSFA